MLTPRMVVLCMGHGRDGCEHSASVLLDVILDGVSDNVSKWLRAVWEEEGVEGVIHDEEVNFEFGKGASGKVVFVEAGCQVRYENCGVVEGASFVPN